MKRPHMPNNVRHGYALLTVIANQGIVHVYENDKRGLRRNHMFSLQVLRLASPAHGLPSQGILIYR